jgi:hypothetical protein
MQAPVAVNPQDRRKYRRIRVPLYFRPAGVTFLASRPEPVDVSLGGVRVFCDEELQVGQLLKMEFFLHDTEPLTYTGEVVRVDRLGVDAQARFDVGLRFLQLGPDALERLVTLLGPEGE